MPNLVLHGHVDMEDQSAWYAWTRAPVWCVWMQVQNILLHEMWEAAEAAVPTRVIWEAAEAAVQTRVMCEAAEAAVPIRVIWEAAEAAVPTRVVQKQCVLSVPSSD